MFSTSIQDILAARLQRLPALVVEMDLTRDIDELVASHFPAGSVAVVDDVNTSTAYGNQVFRALSGRFNAIHLTLSKGVQADGDALAEVEQKSKHADFLVAVGSGTVNDLVKLASFKAGKPYLLFPTAASMNGYVSANASISLHGHKTSLAAHLPQAVFMDMRAISCAPVRLSQAGLGDSLARSTAQADWLLSHHLLGTEYDDALLTLMMPYEEAVFGQARGIAQQDTDSIAALMKLLLLSGYSMTMAGNSAPASGAEHMIAHAYAMSNATSFRDNLHGEEIAITTLAAAYLQEKLLNCNTPPALHLHAADERIAVFFDEHTQATMQPLYAQKITALTERFPHGQIPPALWEKIRETMAKLHLPTAALQRIAMQAGLPDSVEKLGWNKAAYTDICTIAHRTRDRLTCLDIR